MIYLRHYPFSYGPGSSVGIATNYGLDGPGDRIPVGAKLSAHLDRPWGPTIFLYNGYRVFPMCKVRPEGAADPSPPSSAEVLEE